MNMTADMLRETVSVALEGSMLSAKGALTVNTLSSALKQLAKVQQMVPSVSFNAVDIADSSAVVFLLACQRQLGTDRLTVLDMPDRVMRLINLYDLSVLFNFSNS